MTSILVTALVCSVLAGLFFALKSRRLAETIEEYETDWSNMVNKYTDSILQVNSLKSEVAKLKRKPRKDKGQSRKTYNGKPVTRKRKSNKGE